MSSDPIQGGCVCGRVRYRLRQAPLIVHACHCRMCQCLSGGAFAVNALVEHHNIDLVSGEIMETHAPTPSGLGQIITRCKTCQVAVWSEYVVFTLKRQVSVRFIRAGTLDQPGLFPPDVHIYTATMQSHAQPSDGKPRFEGFYNLAELWPASSLRRLDQAKRPVHHRAFN